MKKVKYLGLTLDSKLTFAEHIKSVAQKAVAKLITLYPLLNRRSKVTAYNKMLIYKIIIRPALVYACPIWSMICKSQYNNLQTVQNKFLRLIGNYRRYTLITEMHNKLEIEHISEFIKKLTIDYYNKIEKHPNQLVRKIKYCNKKYKHRRIMKVVYENN